MGSTIIDASHESMSDLWLADDGPVSQSSLTTNLACRVVFGLLSNLLMWVPLTLLRRNGEFAAVVLILVTMVYNSFTVVNALIWRSDDVSTWWMGYGYCDLFVYLNPPILTLYTSSVFAIMRNLADQISLMRANSLNLREKRRRNIIQALIIFPVPLVQLAWVYPVSIHRYYLLTLVGCTWWPVRSWPTLVFFCIPQPAFALGAAWYAVITFWRFRQLSKSTISVLSTTNSRATSRARRAKRRLYFMTLAILVPYLPILLMFFVNNVRYILPLDPYDPGALRRGEIDGMPWDSVILIPSRALDFATLNDRYTAILTAVPVFGFFGLSKDAVNLYRVFLLALGLGRVWPALREEYDPDRGGSHIGSSRGTSGILTSSETTHSYTKSSPSVTHASHVSHPSTPQPPPETHRRFRFLSFHRHGGEGGYGPGGDATSSSTARIIEPGALELRPADREPRVTMRAIHDHGGACVETRVWSVDEEAGEGPSHR